MTKFERHIIEQEHSKDKLFSLAEAIVARYRDELTPEEIFGQLEKLRPHASRQFWSETVSWAVANGTAVSNTVTETILFPNVTLPANFMQDGRILRINANGSFGTASATPGVNLVFSLRWGGVSGTLICKSGGLITPTTVALTAAVWDLEAEIQTRSNGSAGTLMAFGLVHLHDTTVQTMRSATNVGAFGPMTQAGQSAPAIATLDLTADTALALTITMSAANASNTITGMNYFVEALN